MDNEWTQEIERLREINKELLEACEEMENTLRTLSHNNFTEPFFLAVSRKKMLQAIAKAKGE